MATQCTRYAAVHRRGTSVCGCVRSVGDMAQTLLTLTRLPSAHGVVSAVNVPWCRGADCVNRHHRWHFGVAISVDGYANNG